MKSATSIPPARAERAMQLADELETHSSEQADLARTRGDELELTGELPKDFVSKMEQLLAREHKTLAALTELSTKADWQR